MNISCPTTLVEIVWYLLLLIVGAAFVELRWTIRKMIVKLDELPEKYVTKEYMNKWEVGRDGPEGLWHAINKHSHAGIEGSGKVTRS